MKKLLLLPFCISILNSVNAQDTFSIVAVDSVTGEVGSAGASCVDLITYYPTLPIDFLSELFPGVGAINSQAAYDPTNQANARARMNAGDSPSQIISWLVANDVNSTPTTRQYGIVRLNSSPKTAGYTGGNCMDEKKHIAGINYCIQGNILLDNAILDSMEARFKREQGDLACKLMAAMQGANVPGADSRCLGYGTSSLFAFLKVSQPTDAFGSPSFRIALKTNPGSQIEPIDSLQTLFNKTRTCVANGINNQNSDQSKISVYPNPATNSITIKISGNKTTEMDYIIRDVLGRKILENKINTEEVISIENWNKGMYFIEVRDEASITLRKIIKQ